MDEVDVIVEGATSATVMAVQPQATVAAYKLTLSSIEANKSCVGE